MTSADGRHPGSLLSAQASALSSLMASRLSEPLAREGLTMTGFELLGAVKSAGGATQVEIAKRLEITAASLSESVKSAVAAGWLRQEAVEGDRRMKRLALSPAGARLLDKIVEEVRHAEVRMLQGLDARSVEHAAEVLRRAILNLGGC
jgi:DNA-binding MarR family transcriptional regulator